MQRQDQDDCTNLIAQLKEARNPGNLIRVEVFDAAECYSGNGHPPIAYAQGISEEHYGEAARYYGNSHQQGMYEKSIGPNKDQWGPENPPRGYNDGGDDPVTWTNEFAEDNVDLYIKPPNYGRWLRDQSQETLEGRNIMLLWLAEGLDLPGYTPNPWRKANALALMKTAKEEMQASGTPWTFGLTTPAEELKEFAQAYAGILADARPPAQTCGFPGVVPKTINMDGGKKQARDKALKSAYQAHMIQYSAIADWVQKERELTRWFKRMQQNKKARKDSRNPESPDLEVYVRCTKRFCGFTICGVNKPFIPQPADYKGKDHADCEYKRQYTVESDSDNGRMIKTYSHKDDGRGDEGRLERYKLAMKDHLAFAHTYDPKKAINVKPPTFKMKMSPEEFEEQKEIWRRFQISYPDNTPELFYDMLQQSIDVELFKIIKSEMDALEYKATEESVAGIISTIEKNAVIKVPNEIYMAAFEKIKQEEGERVQPYLSRIKTAAVKVELKRRGRCNEQSHPGAQVQLPCPEAKKWAEEVRKAEAADQEIYISDDVELGGVSCPKCCKDTDDEERKKWMIKKLFLNNLRVQNHKNQIMMRLQQHYTSQGSKAKFDALKFNIGFIRMVAVQIEEVYERNQQQDKLRHEGMGSKVENARRTNAAPRGQRGGRGTGNRGGGNNTPNNAQKRVSRPGQERAQRIPGVTQEGKCAACGEEPHSPKKDGKPVNTMQDREQKCKAWDKLCHKCGKKGHLGRVCRSKPGTQGGAGGENPAGQEDEPQAGAATTYQWNGSPGDHEDWNAEWENQYGEQESLRGGNQAEAMGGNNISTMAGQCMAKACQECIYTVAPGLAPEEVSERKRRAMGFMPQMTLPEDTVEMEATSSNEDTEQDDKETGGTIIRMETMRRSKSKRKSLTLEKERPLSLVYESESTKEVLVPVKKNQGNGKGGEQKE